MVKAIRDAERSQGSNRVEVEIPNPAADLAPSKVAAEVTDDGVSLAWDAPAEDPASVTAYEIERTAELPDNDNVYVALTPTGDAATAYTDTSANEAGARYTYRVRAVRDSEWSQWSGSVSVELPEPPPRFDFSHITLPSVLVKNTGQTVGSAGNALASTVPKRAQAFTTGANPAGYTLGSIGFRFSTIADTSTAGGELTAMLNEVDGSNPGDALCTLTDPGSFTGGAVNTFTAPTSGTLCPTLEAETTYFFVLERSGSGTTHIWLNNTPNDAEDADSKDDWSVAYERLYEQSGTWTSSTSSAHMIEVNGIVDNNPATGAPSIRGVLETGETLTADTVGISDLDGPDSPSYTYQWISNDGSTDTRISGATGSTYDLTSTEEGDGIKLEVSFTDDAGHSETLTSAQTENVVASGATTRLLWLGTLTAGRWPVVGLISLSGYSALNTDLAGGALVPGAFVYDGTRYDVTHLTSSHSDGDTRFATSPAPQAEELAAWILGYNDSSYPLAGAAAVTRRGGTDTVWELRPISYDLFTVGEDHVVTLTEAVNQPPTGAPSIRGVLQTGETLTADTVGIADADGPDSPTYSYQWISNDGTNDTRISGATGSTYELTSAEEGDGIKLEVSFTDDAGHSETLTSAQTENVAASGATTRLLWIGTMAVGEDDDGDTGYGGSLGSLSPAAFTYDTITQSVTRVEWSPGSSLFLLNVSMALTANQVAGWTLDAGGHDLALAVADETGGTGFIWVEGQVPSGIRSWAAGQVVTVALVESLNAAPTGAPSIRGVLQTGEELTADTVDISDADGLTTPNYTYQWIKVDSSNTETPITGATASAYTLTSDEENHRIKLEASFTDDKGYTATLTSAITQENVVAENATRRLLWLATLTVGVTAESKRGFDSSGGGLSPASFTHGSNTHRVIRLEYSSGLMNFAFPASIGAENAAAWKLFAGSEGALADAFDVTGDQRNFRFTGSALPSVIAGWNAASIGQDYTVSLQEAVNVPPTGAPTITGPTEAEQTLTADTSGISDANGLTSPTYRYEWIRVDSSNTESPIGTDSSTYTVVAADVGNTIKVQVTFTDDDGFQAILTSDPHDHHQRGRRTATGSRGSLGLEPHPHRHRRRG